jgi:hypothetical protein
MKIVFSDIEGVLISARSYFLPKESRRWPIDGSVRFDPLAVAGLNRICERTGAFLVFSSKMCARRSADAMRAMAQNNGILAPVIDAICPTDDQDRLACVERWLDQRGHGGAVWCLIDDCPIRHKWAVTPNTEIGLSIRDYRRAMTILGVEDPFVVYL